MIPVMNELHQKGFVVVVEELEVPVHPREHLRMLVMLNLVHIVMNICVHHAMCRENDHIVIKSYVSVPSIPRPAMKLLRILYIGNTRSSAISPFRYLMSRMSALHMCASEIQKMPEMLSMQNRALLCMIKWLWLNQYMIVRKLIDVHDQLHHQIMKGTILDRQDLQIGTDHLKDMSGYMDHQSVCLHIVRCDVKRFHRHIMNLSDRLYIHMVHPMFIQVHHIIMDHHDI
jgi:hypothetical protein